MERTIALKPDQIAEAEDIGNPVRLLSVEEVRVMAEFMNLEDRMKRCKRWRKAMNIINGAIPFLALGCVAVDSYFNGQQVLIIDALVLAALATYTSSKESKFVLQIEDLEKEYSRDRREQTGLRIDPQIEGLLLQNLP